MNNHALAQRIAELEERQAFTEQRIALLERLLHMKGVDYPWLSVRDATTYVNQDADTIRRQIREAEAARTSASRHRLKLGKHYRPKGRGQSRPTWEINIDLWNQAKALR